MTNRPGGRDRFENGAYRKGMRIETSVILQCFARDLVRNFCRTTSFGRLTGRGAGDAWKAFGTRKRVGIVRSIFRQSRAVTEFEFTSVFGGARFWFRKVNRTGVRHPFEAGRHRKVWGSRPRLSASSRSRSRYLGPHPEEPAQPASRRMAARYGLAAILRDASLRDAPQDEVVEFARAQQ
jgi:hypothetical protein